MKPDMIPTQYISALDITHSECFWSRSRSRTKSSGWSTDGMDHQEEIKLMIRDPRTHIDDGKAVFTDYKIEIKANGPSFALRHTSVRRRYSEFVWLHEKLSTEELSGAPPPPLPDRRIFGRFSTDFIKNRQQGLEDFLQGLVTDEAYLCNAPLHLFLQTDFSTKEIEHCLDHKDREDLHHIIILAAANKRDDRLHVKGRYRSVSDSALESSYSSLDLSDITACKTTEVLSSSGYYGDDEVPDETSEQSRSLYEALKVNEKRLLGAKNREFSSSSELELSIEEKLNSWSKENCKNNKKKYHLVKAEMKGRACSGLAEYLLPISEWDFETYVVYANDREMRIPRRETNDQRIKRMVNEFEVVSIL